jgi:hypothetical protein
MRKLEADHGAEEAAKGLTLAQMHAKLATLVSLFRFEKWDAAANAAYHELFFVDMMQARGRRDALTKSEAVGHQRLGSFRWDVACEFPTPAAPLVVEPHAQAMDEFRSLLREMRALRATHRAATREEGSGDDEAREDESEDESEGDEDAMDVDDEDMELLAELVKERYAPE